MCRYHYGTPVSRDFDPRKHLAEDMYIDELTGERNAKGTYKPRTQNILSDFILLGQMNWLLSKVGCRKALSVPFDRGVFNHAYIG